MALVPPDSGARSTNPAGPSASAGTVPSHFRPDTDVVPSAVGLILVILGISVTTGWILRLPALTQVVPGFTSMVLNTALSFSLMGACLLITRARPGQPSPVTVGIAIAVAVVSVLNLLQIASGASLGINATAIHQWIQDGNPVPGQMATPTSVCFAVIGLGVALAYSEKRERVRLTVSRTAAAFVFSIALIGLVGYVLKLEALYSWYAYSRMAVHTAVGLLLLALSVWQRLNQLESDDEKSLESRIISIGTWSLLLVAVISGLSGTLLLKREIDRESGDGLRLTHQARADLLNTTLQLRSTRAHVVASRLDVQATLRDLQHPEAAAASAIGAQALLDSFLPFGFGSVRLLAVDGRVLAAAGTAKPEPVMSVGLKAESGEVRSLRWNHGFLLWQRFEIRREAVLEGYVETEQALPALDSLLAAEKSLRRTELCGLAQAGLICFPDSGHAAAYQPAGPVRNELAPLEAARRGEHGLATYHSPGGGVRLAAYGPVGTHELYAATSLDSSLLFAPLRKQLSIGFTLVALTTMLGIFFLRRSIRPLTRALAQAEQRYRSVVDGLQEGVLLQGEDSEVLASNPAALKILGVTAEALNGAVAGDSRWRLIDEAGKPVDAADYPAPKALRTGRGERDVVRGVIDRDGRLRWVQISSTLVQRGDASAVVLSFEDITEKRMAQQRLEESEARYQLMVDQVADYAILMLDLDGRITSWNQGAERITGYEAKEIVGQHIARFFPEEDRVRGGATSELSEAARTGRYEMEGWRVRKDGTRFWASVLVTAIRDANGVSLGYAKLVRDLTQRHRADQELAEAWRRVQAIIEASPFGIVATDLSGTIQHMNHAGECMTGYTRAELVGRHSPAIYHDPEEIVTRARELSEETGLKVQPGLDAFVYKARLGLKEEREWTCVRKDGSRFPIFSAITALRDPQGSVIGFMGVAYDISERRRLEDYTRHVANHDYLTGLPMRRLLEDRLQQAMSRARRVRNNVGLLLIDLDHFKRINDSLGHHVGDELLKEVARRLLGCVRNSDTVARMGGDEFVVLVPDVEELSAVDRIAALIVERLSVPVHVGSHELHVTPSVGLAMFPDDADDSAGLLKDADAAMYAAKLAGRGCYRVFSRQMQREAEERLLLENDLRFALRRGQLEVHYQPQVCLQSGSIIGMEALLRWQHPTLGDVSPAQFVPIAEQTDLILELGDWVMRKACRDARKLEEQTGVALTVAVNLSPRQFRSPLLVQRIEDALRSADLAAKRLEIEITEGILMEDADQALERLTQIGALGVGIAVDDFGTGYSSLAYITRFAVDTLKIDRSFVSRLPGSATDEAVTQAIIAIARTLGIKVVAEGVENASQLGFLRARQCTSAQGFLFGKAVPADQFSVQGFHVGKAIPSSNDLEDGIQPVVDQGDSSPLR